MNSRHVFASLLAVAVGVGVGVAVASLRLFELLHIQVVVTAYCFLTTAMLESEQPNLVGPDPLWESFIDSDHSVFPANEQHQPTRSFGSMVAPNEVSEELTPKVGTMRNPEEIVKRPIWLPENRKIDLRVRSSGATAGVIDRYYLDPSGHKYRSKNEVSHFLETGKRLKRSADGGHSGSSVSHKQKKLRL